MAHGFDAELILALNLAGTFAFGLSGGLEGVRARLDLFGVVVLAFAVALAGGITRDLLIGTPPATFRDWRYLAVAGGAGLVSFFARPALERVERGVTVFDAIGLGVFCVGGASTALADGLGPAQSIILGAITGVGGGVVRDVLVRRIPQVLRQELYAVPALIGAAVVVSAHQAGDYNSAFPVIGAVVCIIIRLVAVRYDLGLPVAPSERGKTPPAGGGT